MRPFIFWKIDSYYFFWSLALVVMVLWTKRRASRLYGISRGDAADILSWALLGAFIGATLGGYANRWNSFAANPEKMLRFWEVGVSSGPAFIFGGLLGFFKIKRLRASTDRFAESAAIPCSFMIFIGRIGCFMNGCCKGRPTDSIFGVRFPSNPTAAVWPSQLFESAAGLLIGLSLIAIERGRLRKGALDRAVIFPIFLITYGTYRFIFDFLREGDRRLGFKLGLGQYSGIAACAVGATWLAISHFRGGSETS
jgi:phosphatidylglycerol:prolipoprotein diacylglycerol transferase